ncbi:hypothetical protein Scep_010614 [Stephania cephalantha]|uniref:Uncharacterized protein n=1 Tax=Stephania cephalantha TaxID=152367 RepID=A0AAP0PDG5_9MAGN
MTCESHVDPKQILLSALSYRERAANICILCYLNAEAIMAAVVSVLFFRNPITVIGMIGFVVTIMEVVAYSEVKKRSRGVAPH